MTDGIVQQPAPPPATAPATAAESAAPAPAPAPAPAAPAAEGAPAPAPAAPAAEGAPAPAPAAPAAEGAPGDGGSATGTSGADTIMAGASAPADPAPAPPPEAQTANYNTQGYEMSSEYMALLEAAQKGDPAAIAKLNTIETNQKMMQQLQTQNDNLAKKLEQEQVQQKEGKESKVFKDAKERQSYLERTVKGLNDKANQLSKSGKKPLAEILKKHAAKMQQTRKNLDAKVRVFENNRADAKARQEGAQLKQLTQTGPKTARAKPAKAPPTKAPQVKGKVIVRAGGLVKVKGNAETTTAKKTTPVTKGDQPKTATKGSKGEKAPDKVAKDAKKADNAKVADPTKGEQEAAKAAAAARLSPEERAENERRFKERGRAVKKARADLADARGKLDCSPKAASKVGAEELCRVRQVERRYRYTQERGYRDLEGGRTAGLCGLVFCDRGVAGLAGERQTATDRLHSETDAILDARPGDEKYEENQAALAKIVSPGQKTVRSDYEPGEKGNIFGYFRNWVPRSEREVVGADLHSDYIGEARA